MDRGSGQPARRSWLEGIGGGPVDRRTALALLGLAAVAAACSKAAKKVGLGGSNTPASSTPPTNALTPVPASERIPDEVLRSDASFNGTYAGTWESSDGSRGTARVTAAIDPARRTAHGTVTIGAGFFGAGSPEASEAQDYDLDDFAYEKPPYHVASSILGPVTVTGMGSLLLQLDSNQIPGHPEIASFTTKGSLTGPDVLPDGGMPFTYEIHLKNGQVTRGTVVFRTA